jgi:integrase
MKAKSISGLTMRGEVYWLKMSVPKAYSDIEPKKMIEETLRTKDRREAEARCAIAKLALRREWDALRAGRSADHRALFDASTELLRGWGMTFSPMQDLVMGPIDDLLARMEKLSADAAQSFAVPAALGAVDLPDLTFIEMAGRMPQLKAADIKAKNARQRREWSSNFIRAAKDFTAHIGKRTIFTVSEQDAIDYEDFWKGRYRSGEVTANYASKQIRYVRQMINAHYDDIRLPRSKRKNPFLGMKVEALASDHDESERRRPALPELWIRDKLIGERVLERLHQQDSDIAIISAECGNRGTEVYDMPAGDIHLDHEIPHIKIRIVTDGEGRRDIKNKASKRPVILLGASLEAMRRHPLGFPRHRGKARYSTAVNDFLREHDLLPELPPEATKNYTISCTRHSFEDRMIAAKMDNEERAYLMGHSIGAIRGRPVYGSDLDLRIRALFQEMISFETPTWTPRPIKVLRREIDKILNDKGHRTE